MFLDKYYQNFLQLNPYPRQLKNYSWVPDVARIYLKRNGKSLLNFSSNDYLGLSTHPLLIARVQEYATKYGVGSSSSRLVAGNFAIYEKLESELAKVLQKPTALILGTGFQANTSVLAALLDVSVLEKEPLVFCDRFCHSSMMVGIHQRARLQRFQHNNLNHLQELLEKHEKNFQPKFILAESIYSMDGDQTDLLRLTQLAEKHQAFLYIDDAHAVGVCGKEGWGKAPEQADKVDVIMGTFSKALGCFGAYIGCSEIVRDYLINKCKGLIYSTGLSPMLLGAISAVLEIVPQLETERKKLIKHANILRDFFQTHGLNLGSSTTHIVPWIIGDAKKTLQASELLETEGILATTIRPPSVLKNQCRIRFCLSAAHTDADVEYLMESLLKVAQKI